MKRVIKKLYQINKNRKQFGEMILVVGAIYTYFLYNSIAKGWQDEQKTTRRNY